MAHNILTNKKSQEECQIKQKFWNWKIYLKFKNCWVGLGLTQIRGVYELEDRSTETIPSEEQKKTRVKKIQCSFSVLLDNTKND